MWRRGIVRKIALNPVYIGKRVLRGESVGGGQWKPLVSEETYWAVRNMLENPGAHDVEARPCPVSVVVSGQVRGV